LSRVIKIDPALFFNGLVNNYGLVQASTKRTFPKYSTI
jgi:hypothetical protein